MSTKNIWKGVMISYPATTKKKKVHFPKLDSFSFELADDRIFLRNVDGCKVKNVFLVLLADEDVRKSILRYQDSEQDPFYYYIDCDINMDKVVNVITSQETDDLENVTLFQEEIFRYFDGMIISHCINLRIRDLVELSKTYGLTKNMNPLALRSATGGTVNYTLPACRSKLEVFNTLDFKQKPSRIL